jgi:hypothetical protein
MKHLFTVPIFTKLQNCWSYHVHLLQLLNFNRVHYKLWKLLTEIHLGPQETYDCHRGDFHETFVYLTFFMKVVYAKFRKNLRNLVAHTKSLVEGRTEVLIWSSKYFLFRKNGPKRNGYVLLLLVNVEMAVNYILHYYKVFNYLSWINATCQTCLQWKHNLHYCRYC